MTIRWSYKAQQQQDETADYIYLEFGEKAVADFYRRIDKAEADLLTYSEIGKVEPLLANRPKVYRSFVIYRLSKLVYSVESDAIQVVAFWDCRREPKTLTEGTKIIRDM